MLSRDRVTSVPIGQSVPSRDRVTAVPIGQPSVSLCGAFSVAWLQQPMPWEHRGTRATWLLQTSQTFGARAPGEYNTESEVRDKCTWRHCGCLHLQLCCWICLKVLIYFVWRTSTKCSANLECPSTYYVLMKGGMCVWDERINGGGCRSIMMVIMPLNILFISCRKFFFLWFQNVCLFNCLF